MLMARLAYVQSQTDPASGARLAVKEIAAGSVQDEAVISVVHQWALRDLAGAQAWVNKFPEGPIRVRASTELIGVAASKTQ